HEEHPVAFKRVEKSYQLKVVARQISVDGDALQPHRSGIVIRLIFQTLDFGPGLTLDFPKFLVYFRRAGWKAILVKLLDLHLRARNFFVHASQGLDLLVFGFEFGPEPSDLVLARLRRTYERREKNRE